MNLSRAQATAALVLLAGCADPAAGPAPAQMAGPADPALARAVETITANDIYRRVAVIADDSMRGRDTPSPGLEATARYLIREYERLGLEPAGENGTFYQRYPYRVAGLDTATAHFGTVLADGSGNQMLEYGTDFFALAGGRGGEGVDMGHGKLMFVGRLPASGLPDGDYRGAVPVVSISGGYGASWLSEVRRAREAARAAGAVALVAVLDSTFPHATVRTLTAASKRHTPTLGEGDPGEIAVFYLTHRAYAAVAARAVNAGRFASAGAPVAVEGLDAHFAAQQAGQVAMPPNVVAVLRGSDPVLRDEYVILSAHMDHDGVGAPVNGDSIYNGADDDASGTSALLEVAEAMATLPTRPRRSVIFLHVSGEEKGLLGSEWYSDHPTVPLDRIVANINVDMIARNSPDTVVVIGKNYSTLGRTVNQVQARHPELGLTLSDDIWPQERFFFRSDHFNFARKEIPAIFFFSGVHEDYHRPSDEVDKLNVDKAARIARIIFYTAEAVANETARPQWDPRGLAEVRALTR